MAAAVPDWLNSDFFKSCLEAKVGGSRKVIVTNHTIEPGVEAGNNYGSCLLRAKIDYKVLEDSENHSLSLIVKAPKSWEGYLSDDAINTLYDAEPLFYKYISETKKLINHDLVPKHYYSPNPHAVVLEDLKDSGYAMVDRKKLLDFDHCQLYVRASAKMHALSVAVFKESPELIEPLSPNNESTANMDNLMKSMTKMGLQCTITWVEDHPQYNYGFLDILKQCYENDSLLNIADEVVKSFSTKPLKALTQADPWCTNMMFKYDSSGKPVGIKLLDFQCMKYTTPVKELATFMAISPNIEVRKTKLSELYNLYFESLNRNLEELGCPERISVEEFKEVILALTPWMIIVICTMLPFIFADQPADMGDYLSEINNSNIQIRESPIYKLYSGETFEKCSSQLLEFAAKEGMFTRVKEMMSQG